MPYNDRLFQLLAALTPSELAALWTEALGKTTSDKDFWCASPEQQVVLISAEWRAAHGHTLRNRFRGEHDLPWKQMLIDVADKLKPGTTWTAYSMEDSITEPQLEHIILGYLEQRTSEKLAKLISSQKAAADQTELPRRAANEAVACCLKIQINQVAGLGAVVVSAPAAFALAANGALSTAYRKSVPATLMLLGAHRLRRELAQLE